MDDESTTEGTEEETPSADAHAEGEGASAEAEVPAPSEDEGAGEEPAGDDADDGSEQGSDADGE